MIKNIVTRALAALAFATGAGAAVAEDIDIYSQNTNITTSAPNVLIVMDNSANWSATLGSGTKFSAEMAALRQVVSALTTQFNLGVAFYSESGTGNTGNQGGYVRFAIQGMTDSSGNATSARNCLLQMLGGSGGCTSSNPYYSALDIGNDKGSFNMLSLGMAEAYLYYAGLNAYAGNNKVKADPLAFVSGSNAGPTYKSPLLLSGSCPKNFIIHINNGPNEPSAKVTDATTLLSTAGGDTTIISPPDNGSSNNSEADEWTRFLNKVSTVNAVTYTLEVGPTTNTTGVYNTALLTSMGTQGKGGYFSAVDSASLLTALTRIFNDINAKNSVFASSSLPLSADNSGAYLNQVYMGVFRPDEQGRPRWYGNLKQYQFALDVNSNLSLVDRKNEAAASASTGFAQSDVISFWTSLDDNFTYNPTATPPTLPATPYTSAPDSLSTYTANPGTNGFWSFDPKGNAGNFDSPDGEFVEKGGAAQQLRLAYLGYGTNKSGTPRGSIGTSSTGGRKVYTCTGTCLTAPTPLLSSTPFESSNTDITNAMLGTVEATVTSIAPAPSKSVTNLTAGTSVGIISVDKSTGVVTTAGHTFSVGDAVTIAGTTSNAVNGGPYSITAVNGTSFTIAGINGNGTETGGTATKATTTATATSAAHGFSVGQSITIAGASPTEFNGVFTIASASTNSFTYTLSTALGVTATGTTITARSNIATATATAHGLTTNDVATITGATPSGYNGTYSVTVVDANTFKYTYPTAAETVSATGTITVTVGGGRTNLLSWIRGMDTQDENGNGSRTDVRASIHGDVLHSRPVVLNYSSNTTSNNVYLFYGGNDGVFRAIKGGQAATDGAEQWAFIPKEFFGQFKRLYNNSPLVLYSSTQTPTTATKRDYFWDGPVGSYIERNSAGTVTKAYLYIAVRRGGRFIYALDVTTPTTPKLLWRKGCTSLTDNTTCDTGFQELGQTWSQPQVAKVRASTNPVLIFGGGFDAASEDTEPPATTDTMGRAVFVLDAYTGTPFWTAGNSAHSPDLSVTGMNFSIAADVLPVDRTFDGYIDRVYAADVGGNVWRLDINDTDKANWRVWKIASVGDRTSIASSRKFLFGMDVVAGDTFDSIVIGSGDREHPLATNSANSVVNRVYMFKDPNIGTVGANLGIFDRAGATITTTNVSADLFDATNSSTVPSTATGWFITLASGEKIVNAPVVAGGNMLFGTNQPDTSNTSCTGNLGIARRYSISYLTGEGSYKDSSGNTIRSEIITGGGFLPSAVTGVVEIGNQKVIFATDNPLNPGGTAPIKITVPTKRYRTYWFEKLE